MPSSVTKHTIPPFYACYFLRSLSTPGTTYIGSTPAPPRRKRQHNGHLTQGAYKTSRARPWEMECIVYGFSSKIAALQFEWAWAKPHLSRHLKFLTTEHSVDGTPKNTSDWAGMSLFPSTSLTPGQTRWGRPKKRMARPPSSPNARLLAMRALLRSEPFCGWGLKLAFFTEWSWLAYQRLDACDPGLVAKSALSTLQNRYSRSGKPLHALYPVAVCDFSGVDGKREPLVHVSEPYRLDAGVAEHPVKKRQTSSRQKPHTEETSAWPETLPRSANLKGLDACMQDFATFPILQPAAPNTDLTKKSKRAKKLSDKARPSALEDHDAENGVDDDDTEVEVVATDAANGSDLALSRPLYRMRFDDLNMEESEWKRFAESIAANVGASRSTTQAMSEFLHTCVQRHIAAQDARTANTALPAPTSLCSLCSIPIDLSQQLDFVLCPNPHASTLPLISSSSTASHETISECRETGCDSIFHLSCLARSFLEQQLGDQKATASSASTVLPTHGTCPCHRGEHKEPTMWADVVRAMYRRHERFERLIQFLIRSGRSLEQHLHPPLEVEMTVKGSKIKERVKASVKATEDAQVDIGDQRQVISGTTSRTKAALTRKRRQPTTSSVNAIQVDPLARNGSKIDGDGAGKDTKKNTTLKAKSNETSEVIDLT